MASKQPRTTSPPTAPHFSPASLSFLRQLARNNRREWFEERRLRYESDVKSPMLTLIARVTVSMADFAPAHVHPPEKIMMRIYRDIRFSADKRPYKSHVAAWWKHDGLPRTSGAGFYLQIAPREVIIAAGVYMPPREQLLSIRTFLLEHHAELRRELARPQLARLMSTQNGDPLTRAPKGFPTDHPALDLIRQQWWGVSATLAAEAALDANFSNVIIRCFRAAAPVVELLNRPLATAATHKRKPLFALD